MIKQKLFLIRAQVSSEEIVYNAVLHWIHTDTVVRSGYLYDLLKHNRLPLLTPKFLTDVCDQEILIKTSIKCRDLLDEAKRFYLRPELRSEMTGMQFKTRSGKNENLIILGGFGPQQKPLDSVEKYSPRTNTWSNLPVTKQFYT
jgi:kelch-like protein 12